MVERQDYVALDWVAGEIKETLNQASQALETYIVSRDDATKLGFCLTHIHQVLGILRMVEFFGAALLAEEMEYVADALSHGDIHETHKEDALQVLKEAMRQLPRYLEYVKESRHGLPSILLPLLNDLRAVRGQQLVSETVLFSPDMSVLTDTNYASELAVTGRELTELAGKLRQMYQIALLNLIHGKERRKNLNYLAKVCARLVKISEGQVTQPLWRICIAVFEGLLNGSIEISVSVKILLRQIDRQIKNIIDHHERAITSSYPEDLLKNLLFYVAHSKSKSRYIKDIKTEFNLDNSLLVEGDVVSPDNSVMQAVIEALINELSEVHRQIHMAANDKGLLAEILPLFRRVCDTMAILGLGGYLKEFRELYSRFSSQLAMGVDTSELASILSAIEGMCLEISRDQPIQTEQKPRLFNDSEEAQQQLDNAFDSVIVESRTGLQQVKEAVIEFVENHCDHSCLAKVPEQLQSILGSLAMLPLARASQIVKSCEAYVSDDLIEKNSVPDGPILDSLADAISSIDYYLERLAEDPETDGSDFLDMAAESVAELGYPISDKTPILVDEGAAKPPLTVDVDPAVLNHDQPQPLAPFLSDLEPPVIEVQYSQKLGGILSADDIPILAEAIESELEASEHEFDIELEDDSATDNIAEPVSAHSAVEAIPQETDFDPEMADIFVEEAGEVLDTIAQNLPTWRADRSNLDARANIRRGYHTLKGSGRMVAANDIGELAWSIESLLNKIIEGVLPLAEGHLELVAEVADHLPLMLEAFKHRKIIDNTPAEAFILRANNFMEAKGQTDAELAEAALARDTAAEVAELVIEVPANSDTELVLSTADETDNGLLDIFAGEAATHRAVLNQFIAHCHELAGPAKLTDELQRALHTLKGSAHMAAVMPVAVVVSPVEGFIKDLRAMQMKADEAIVELLEKTSVFIQQGTDQLATTPMKALVGTEEFLSQLALLHKERLAAAAEDKSIAPEALNDFLTASLDIISDVSDQLPAWQANSLNKSAQQDILEQFSDLIEHGDAINMSAHVELAQAMQIFYRQAIDAEEQRAEFFELAGRGNDALIDMLDQIAGHQAPKYDPALLTEIKIFDMLAAQTAAELEPVEKTIDTITKPLDAGISEQELDSASEIIAQLIDTIADEQINEQEIINQPDSKLTIEQTSELIIDELPAKNNAGQMQQNSNTEVDYDDDDINEEILEVFLEEADELLELLDESIHNWDDDRGNRAHPDELLRVLHTLKGGARLTNQEELAGLSHDFETSLESLNLDSLQADDKLLAETLASQDKLIALLEKTKQAARTNGQLTIDDPGLADPTETSADFAERSDKGHRSNSGVASEKLPEFKLPVNPLKQDQEIAPFTSAVVPPADGVSPLAGDLKRGPQEVVKVPAKLLEELVNLAGETSISRGRAEEQISELVFSLEDMQTTVDRLQGQVRRLDMETEQQILYRQEQVESEGLEGFDPLEMDRYSQLQQLSRSLLESSSDLSDIKGTLGDKARDMETLLVQQSRINTELQEGLMRSRMVPFSRMLPRLRRVVRQMSSELDKKVDFRLNNVEGELDRTVLERMVSPLEHMLRNAVDHGIESREQREVLAKPARGTVSLDLTREGGEIVLTLTDDGAGMDINAIKKKAIERGLMEADAHLSNREILQFILQAGFSTAAKLTQISGRGVGMDVVHSEIKQLGGTVEIESIQGQGTRFIVRLPFTVSVNRALMVNIGGDSYAIPLNTIEGIVRVNPFELEAYYQPDAPMFEYAGQSYLLRYMGALLNRGEKPNLEGRSMPLPVILVRGADHSVAIQVDHLMGSREIVVKPLGPQFSMVQGLSGATVLGDGNVVIILDLPAMIRSDALHLHRSIHTGQEVDVYEQQKSTLVMVVDDSVTVRKVTSRFLERQGFEVVLAKDGIDAVGQLNEMERIPDIMLLDIEMPRMDGFEVAGRIRHTSRLKNMPIIMITSRTGEKHRERAMSLGVNNYLGKPFQELILLETIEALTAVSAAKNVGT